MKEPPGGGDDGWLPVGAEPPSPRDGGKRLRSGKYDPASWGEEEAVAVRQLVSPAQRTCDFFCFFMPRLVLMP